MCNIRLMVMVSSILSMILFSMDNLITDMNGLRLNDSLQNSGHLNGHYEDIEICIFSRNVSYTEIPDFLTHYYREAQQGFHGPTFGGHEEHYEKLCTDLALRHKENRLVAAIDQARRSVVYAEELHKLLHITYNDHALSCALYLKIPHEQNSENSAHDVKIVALANRGHYRELSTQHEVIAIDNEFQVYYFNVFLNRYSRYRYQANENAKEEMKKISKIDSVHVLYSYIYIFCKDVQNAECMMLLEITSLNDRQQIFLANQRIHNNGDVQNLIFDEKGKCHGVLGGRSIFSSTPTNNGCTFAEASFQ